MAKETRLRVTLDMTRARADLAAFYGMLRSAPNITPGFSGGAGGGTSAATIAGGVLGANAIGAAARGGWNAFGFREAREAFVDQYKYNALGIDIPNVSGAMASQGAVAQKFAKLYAMGLIDKDFLNTQRELEDRYGAGLQARGEAMIRRDIGLDTIQSVAGDVAKIIAYEVAAAVGKAIAGGLTGNALGAFK